MKALSTEQPPMPEFPKFWNEEWLKVAIDELDTRKMTADERFNYIKILSYNAEVVHEEREKMAVAKAEGMAEGIEKGKTAAEAEKYALKKEAIRRMMLTKIPDAVMADIVQETPEFVKKVKAQIIQEAEN